MRYTEITNSDDLIDSRQVIERIDELESDDDRLDYEDEELAALTALAEEGAQNAGEWQDGATLIRGSYFAEYAQELAEDIGTVSSKGGYSWPLSHIDWDAAADELKIDYTEIDFAGVPYFVRS
jgi:hypothetical protein